MYVIFINGLNITHIKKYKPNFINIYQTKAKDTKDRKYSIE